MITFIIGLVVLVVGAAVYGRLSEKAFGPSDRETPAAANYDGVDFVPMKKWKNSLIELLNIAGTGPILGPIQGILFGPIVFITIPIGCVIGGAFHDYMSGMISIRNGGEQMPGLVRRFLGRRVFVIYNVLVCLLMLLVGVVFIYTPGDLFVTHILRGESTLKNPATWIAYGVIFAYYIVATLLPIDRIIGRIYPVFGAILLLSAVGVVARHMLGSIGGTTAIIGVIVLPITSGDTALRSLRIMISDTLHIDAAKKRNNLALALMIFAVVAAILIYAKSNAGGFNVLWRYFSWANECTAVFAFAMISVYMARHRMPYLMALAPGMFYMYVVASYILNAPIGFNLPWAASYIASAALTLAYGAGLIAYGKKERTLTPPAE